MKSRITKFAAAVEIIIGVFLGLSYFTGSIDGAGAAFADVLENISNAKNAVYKETFELPDHTFTNEVMALESGIQRSVISTGSIMIFDSKSHTFLWLDPSSKKARRVLNPAQKRSTKGFTYIGWIRKLHEEEAEFVGIKELKGSKVNVYIWEVPFEKITVWVDPETNLPVKVEHKSFANKERNIVVPKLSLSEADFGGDAGHIKTSSISSGRSSGLGIQNEQTATMFDFQGDADRPICWWKSEDTDGYRVIYGDLSIGTLPTEPQLGEGE